jgi:hypothetical protein
MAWQGDDKNGKARQDGKASRQGMPSASACRQGIIIGIGKACHHRHRQDAGRRTAERSKVAQYSHTDIERVLRCAVVKIFE